MLQDPFVDIESGTRMCKALHPQVENDSVGVMLALTAAAIDLLDPPYTVESVAEQTANKSGAFPWKGPVGNGLTLKHFQDSFRKMARDTLTLGKALRILSDPLDENETRKLI
jgi:hypothetical protein